MIFKLSMVLSCIRKYERRLTDSVIYCTDTDFDLAMSIVQVSLESSLQVIRLLPNATPEEVLGQRRAFIAEIPEKFTRKDYQDIAARLKISERSADRWIKSFCKSGNICKISNGNYEKTSVATLAMATD